MEEGARKRSQAHLGNDGQKAKQLEVLRLRQDKLGSAQDDGFERVAFATTAVICRRYRLN
jgi:hypothetical protein